MSKSKKKVYAGSRRRLVLASAIFAVLITVLVGSTFSDWATIITNKKAIKSMNSEYEELLEEEASLKSEVTKLQDPEYIARYAREKFYLSKPGEVIILQQ
ncbi:MAG: septum formation initiator family protein [Bacilli bacterium]